MSLSSLYLSFFAIAVGAFALAEAGSGPVAVNTPGAPSPVTFALLADQQQQNNKVTPAQKESPLGPGQQKKRPLANVLATAGAAAVILALVLFFMKQMKGYLEKEKEMKPEDMVDKPKKLRDLTDEEELELERRFTGSAIGFEDEAMTPDEIDQEARRRIQRRVEIYGSIRWAAGAEGKTKEELLKKAFKEEAWERAKKRGVRYGYEVEHEKFEEDAEYEWKRREELKKKLINERGK